MSDISVVSGRQVGAHQDGCSSIVSAYKSKIFLRMSSLIKKNCCDLNLGEGLCIFTFFLFPHPALYLLNGLDFYFDLFSWNHATLKTSNECDI